MSDAARARGVIAITTLALCAGLVAPIIEASGAAIADPTRAVDAVTPNPKGKFLGVVPSRPESGGSIDPIAGPVVSQGFAQPYATSPVTYHGGPVQHASSVYAIFWAPSTIPFPVNYRPLIGRYFTDVAHDSFTASNPYGADVQYFDGAGTTKRFVSYAVSFKGAFVDTRPYPANGCPNYLLGDGTVSQKCLTNAQILTEIKLFMTARGFPKGINNQFFLFTPKGVASCFTPGGLGSGGCYDPKNFPGYCAYHSFSGAGTQAVIFANMPFANITGCSSGQSPQGNPAADSVINVVSHEHQETMTDPLGTGWYDIDGNEIGDKCLFSFGSPLGTNNFGQYNQVINTRQYWLQQIWSNRAGACVQRNTFPQPTASFTYTPVSPAAGTSVAFRSTSYSGDGTALTYRWLFPSGVVSTAANPSFTFAIPGTKYVTLIVADTRGDQKKVTRIITVR